MRGTVKGPIHARHIHLESGAEVEGDITTTTIAIDTGARLTGAVWQGGSRQPPARERYHAHHRGGLGQRRRRAARARFSPCRPRINGSGR